MEITCPYCYEKFESSQALYRCRGLRCTQEEDETYMRFWTKDMGNTNVQPETRHVYAPRKKFLFGVDRKCDVCGAEDYDYVCPKCHNELPQEMIANGAEIISVIGGPASGKSHYIVALLQELLENGFEIGLRATPMQLGNDTSLHTTTKFEEARRQLNERLNVLEQTDRREFSLPWIIRVDSRDPKVRGKQDPKKSIYLVFYDTSGESFKSPDRMKREAAYLAQSKAVIVLFDTLSIPKIKEILSANNESTVDADKATPFEETWQALENFINDRNQHLEKKPFAFVLSKFDVVLKHSDDLGFNIHGFIDGSGQPIDSSYINGKRVFDVSQVEEADELIRNALRNRQVWNKPKYPDFVENTWGDNGRFFGMSAIGDTPKDGYMIPEGGIRPYRVMDPLLWVMSKLGGFAFETVGGA